MNGKLHKGHRKRMYEKLLKLGAESFEDHELIEIILYSTIARGNTNETAHLLLKRFGSVSAVFEADTEELIRIPGIGQRSAAMLKAASELTRRSSGETNAKQSIRFDINTIGCGLVEKFRFKNTEEVCLLMFDSSLKLIETKTISRGDVNYSDVTARRIAELALPFKAVSVALAHNHPSGEAEPSDHDITATRALKHMLRMIELEFIEHFIISGDRFYAIIDQNSSLFI